MFDEKKFSYTLELIQRLRDGHDVKVDRKATAYGFAMTWEEIAENPYFEILGDTCKGCQVTDITPDSDGLCMDCADVVVWERD